MATVGLWALAGVGALATVIVLACVVVVLWDMVEDRRKRQVHLQWHKIGADYMRGRLLNDCWWFSEDEPTMNLLRRLGEGGAVNRVREDWRHERKAALLKSLEDA